MLDTILWIGRTLVFAIFVVDPLTLLVVSFAAFVEVLCTTGSTLVLVT